MCYIGVIQLIKQEMVYMSGLKQRVKPSDKEIRAFRNYLTKTGFVTHMDNNSFYLYMKYGYICVSIEYSKKGEFKDVRCFLSIWWETSKCSRYYFPNYYDFGAVRRLDRDYVEKCTVTSTNVMVAISDMLDKIASLLPRN